MKRGLDFIRLLIETIFRVIKVLIIIIIIISINNNNNNNYNNNINKNPLDWVTVGQGNREKTQEYISKIKNYFWVVNYSSRNSNELW